MAEQKMPGREEIDAIWEKLKEHEQLIQALGQQISDNTLMLAQWLAHQMIMSDYNHFMTSFNAMAPGEVGAYQKYMGPKLSNARNRVLTSTQVKEIFEISMQFSSDCVSYWNSRL